MREWNGLFQPHILSRGLDYYDTGAVSSLEKTDLGYRAVVEGTQDYKVEIRTRDGEIVDMDCSCPYADGGSHCKHMAAVLYALEDSEPGEIPQKNQYGADLVSRQELRNTVALIPEQELRELVISLTESNPALFNRILTKYAPVSPELIARLKGRVDEIADEYSDRSGYVNYRDAIDYANELDGFIYENVQALVDNGHLAEAFDLTNYVFQEIRSQNMDASDGEITKVADSCYEYWKQILSVCDEAQTKRMFNWFQAQQNHSETDYMEDYINEILMDEFHSKDMLWEKMKHIDAKIEKVPNGGNEFYIRYAYVHCILQRINIMEELGCSRQEIAGFRNKYRQFPDVRKLEIQDYIKHGDYDKAVEVLRESKLLDKGNRGLVSDYSEHLIDLYEKTGLTEEYKEEIVYQVFQCSQSSLKYMMKLKDVCETAEWEDYREKLLASETTWQTRYMLLEIEELYSCLLQEVKKSGSAYIMDQYEKTLKKYFPEETRDMYINYVQSEAYHASDRNAYRNVIQYLKKIVKYPGGEASAAKLATQWRQEYKRRSAMMDELGKAGF